MADFEKVPCVVCGSDSLESITEVGQHGHPAFVVVCRDCGLSFLSPRWNKARYAYYYTNEYYETDKREDFLKDNKETFAAAGKMLKRFERAACLPTQVNTILDIGSGRGDYIDYLRQHKYPEANYYAIEPSNEAVAHLEQQNVTVVTRDVDTDWHEQNKGRFDLIVMRHVLEHFLNPIEVLSKVAQTLSPNGVLYIAVPNAAKPQPPMINSFFRVPHTFYYAPKSLTDIAQLSGLTVLKTFNGDDLERGELAMFFKVGAVVQPVFSKSDYEQQVAIYRKQMAAEKHPLYAFKTFVRRRVNKYLKWQV